MQATKQITIREIQSHNITVTADEIGIVWVNGIETSRPVTAGGVTFVWAPKAIGLPVHAKIGLSSNDVAKIEDFAAAHHADQAAKMAKARAWNNANNEGGDGYNPYEQQPESSDVQTISSQRYLDDTIVEQKIEAQDFEVMVSSVFALNGKQYRVVLDGHHSLAAAKQAGVEPVFFEATATDHDAVALLADTPEHAGNPEAFLEVVYIECDYHDAYTGDCVDW